MRHRRKTKNGKAQNSNRESLTNNYLQVIYRNFYSFLLKSASRFSRKRDDLSMIPH